jgi:hypothetical protein
MPSYMPSIRSSHARAASLTSAIHVLLSGVYIGFDLRVSLAERSRDPLDGRKCGCADQSGLSIGAHLNQRVNDVLIYSAPLLRRLVLDRQTLGRQLVNEHIQTPRWPRVANDDHSFKPNSEP